MSIKKKISVFLVMIICISTILVGCGTSPTGIAKEKFETEVKAQVIEKLRNVSGLDDLDIDTVKTTYKQVSLGRDRVVNLEAKITLFTSDEIDEYFTTEEHGSDATKLVKILSSMNNIIDDREGLTYTYTYDSEGIKINIKVLVGLNINVKTSGGNIYSYSHSSYNDSHTLSINDDLVYWKPLSQSGTATNTTTSSSSSTSSYRAVTDRDTLVDVWYVATQFVEDKLKSPKSAEFPRYNDSSVEIKSAGNSYKVTGYVDADNSFGAKVRVPFIVVMEKSGDNYKLKECTLIE